MPDLIRTKNLGSTTRTAPFDLAWKAQPDGTGIPMRRDPANTLRRYYNSASGSKRMLAADMILLDENKLCNIQLTTEFDGGTAIRETDGSITFTDPELSVQ